jgi:hypothetical protein
VSARCKHSTQHLELRGGYKLFRDGRERLIEPCLATIRNIPVDDPTLGSFIDS